MNIIAGKFEIANGIMDKLKEVKNSQNIVQLDENRIKQMPIYRFDVKSTNFLKKFSRNY